MAVDVVRRPSVAGDYMVELANVAASWTNSNVPEEMTIKNLSMRIRKGKLCAIIGPVGSGKVSRQTLYQRVHSGYFF